MKIACGYSWLWRGWAIHWWRHEKSIEWLFNGRRFQILYQPSLARLSGYPAMKHLAEAKK